MLTPAALTLPLLNRTGGENQTEKLVGQNKDKKIPQELPSLAEQT